MWFDKKPVLALAPMADMTDSPFCQICREISGKDFIIFREMVSAEAIRRGNEKTLQMCAFEEKERPIVLQIFGSDPESMLQASKIIVKKYKPDGLDINMGCPVPKITGKSSSGATLIKNPAKAKEIIVALKKGKLGVPISVKTRLGWGRDDEIMSFAKILEKAGVDALTIHGRTKTQGYSGKANWEMIGEVKKNISIPVIANGDIRSADDIKKCLEITGADGVMIGRSALGNPWVFAEVGSLPASEAGRRPEVISLSEVIKVVLKHSRLHEKRYGKGSMVTFRKHLAYYFKGDKMTGIPNLKKLRIKLMRVSSLEELKDLLR